MISRLQPHDARHAVFCSLLSFALASCASATLHQGKSLTSYAGMSTSGGTLTKASVRLDPDVILAARTVRIVPTSVSEISEASFDPKQLTLVSNAIDRALCIELSERFQVVAADYPADLVVRSAITHIIETNTAAAATSTVASLGAGVALPVPIPRLPIGLGGLSVEAEAVSPDGSQKAAMIWSRNADIITTKARLSEVGDAYLLASEFGADFGRMLVTAQDPFKQMPSVPSAQKISAALGGAPKYAACKAFGATPGLKGLIGGQLGLPPAWTDEGSAVSERPSDGSSSATPSRAE